MECTDLMADEIKDWVKIETFLLKRKMLKIDNYKFGSRHMFGELNRLSGIERSRSMVVKKGDQLFGEEAGVPHSDYYQVIS